MDLWRMVWKAENSCSRWKLFYATFHTIYRNYEIQNLPHRRTAQETVIYLALMATLNTVAGTGNCKFCPTWFCHIMKQKSSNRHINGIWSLTDHWDTLSRGTATYLPEKGTWRNHHGMTQERVPLRLSSQQWKCWQRITWPSNWRHVLSRHRTSKTFSSSSSNDIEGCIDTKGQLPLLKSLILTTFSAQTWDRQGTAT